MGKVDIVRLDVWTELFLGTRAKGETLIALLETIDGVRWVPDKWGHFEPFRTPYGPESREAIFSALTEERGGSIANNVNFTKKRPRASIALDAWRGKVPELNQIRFDLDAKALSTPDVAERITKIVLDLIEWSGGIYATARHSKQAHWRMAQKTPEERLERMDWLTFFGEPYLELFGGRTRVQDAPCHAILDVPRGLLLRAAPKPDSPEMTQSDEVLLTLEEYLGADAFAGRGYPDVPCRVPHFDLSETVSPHHQA